MAMGLFQSIDWLTKKVKRLCCWLGIIEEYTGANLPYVEFLYKKGGSGLPTDLSTYNNSIFNTLSSQPGDFSSFVEYAYGDTLVHRVYGSSGNLRVVTSAYDGASSIIALNDPFGLIKEIQTAGFKNANNLQNVYLPNVSVIGDSVFSGCVFLTTIYIPKCTQLGTTVGDDSVFFNIASLYITLKIDPSRLTCNLGGPDGDIAYLQANNSVVLL